MNSLRELLKRYVPYVLVAVLSSAATWFAADLVPTGKLDRLAAAIDRKYIGEADTTAMEDAAAEAMIASWETGGAIIFPRRNTRPICSGRTMPMWASV